MTIFAGDKERNLANTVMDWLLNLGYLGLFLGTFLAGTVLPLSSDSRNGSTNTAYGLRWSFGPPSSAWSA